MRTVIWKSKTLALVPTYVNNCTKSCVTAAAPVQFGQQRKSIEEACIDVPVNDKNLVNVFAP